MKILEPRCPALVDELLERSRELYDMLPLVELVKTRLVGTSSSPACCPYQAVTVAEAQALWDLTQDTLKDRSVPRPEYWKYTASNSMKVLAGFIAGGPVWVDEVAMSIYAHLTFHGWYLLHWDKDPVLAFRRAFLDVNCRLLVVAKMRSWVEAIFYLPPEPRLFVDGATRVRQMRRMLGLSQTEFGKKLGVSRWTVRRYENGEIAPGPAVARFMHEPPGWSDPPR